MQFRFDRVSYQIERFVNPGLKSLAGQPVRQFHFD